MTVSKAVAAEIRRLYFAEHWKRGTIAAQLGVHFDVVVRVLGSFGPKGGSPRPDARVLEPYIPFVDETLSRYPRLVATRIQDMLVERGYEGSVRTLRRYVREARPAPRNEVFLRVETLPGEQAQVDWAHVGSLPVPGGHRALWAFVMVLAYSRAMWAELVVDLGVDSLCRSLVRAAAFFGGCTRQWLFDNAKTIEVDPILRTTEAGGYGGACVSRSLCIMHITNRRSLLRRDMRAVIQGDPTLDAKRRRGEREGGDWQVGDEAVGGGVHGHAAFFACPS